jgi:hypothetical protein
MTEQELLKDALGRLNGAGIRYMLTGSMASNAWGIPRTTHDLDFVLQVPPSQIAALTNAFTGDYFIDEAAIRMAYQAPHQFNAIHVPSALKIDFWMLRPVPFEREMFGRKLRHEILGETAWIATPEDVILHKLYWNQITPSERQLQDAAGVVSVQRGSLDESYLRRWAAELGVTTVLEDLLTGRIRPKST